MSQSTHGRTYQDRVDQLIDDGRSLIEAETLAAIAIASTIDTPPKTTLERYACSKCEGSGKTPARRDQRRKEKCQTCHGTGSHTMLVWTDFDWETHR